MHKNAGGAAQTTDSFGTTLYFGCRARGSKRLTEPFVAEGVFERSLTATPTVGNVIVAAGTLSSLTSCVV